MLHNKFAKEKNYSDYSKLVLINIYIYIWKYIHHNPDQVKGKLLKMKNQIAFIVWFDLILMTSQLVSLF